MTNQAQLTETRNPASAEIDLVSTLDLVRIINTEDAKVPFAVGAEAAKIAAAIDGIVARMRRGGRLIYVGAGTSGRLGVLDASECPPTYSAPPGLVVGLIAGGRTALTNSLEGAEDRPEDGAFDVAALNVGDIDTVVGIAASGRTPYTIGAMEEAKRRGAMALFGDVGARLIPILLRGTRGLDEAAQRARDLGSAFSDDALDAAVDLGAATNGLVTSMRALKDGIGATLTTVVRPLVEGVTRVVQATANWVRENPALVQSLFNITVAVGALGTAVAALAGVVLALTSPLVVTVALLGTVAAAAFAVTDALGVTSTGFGDLFNSIRIGGQGLATWMARLWSFIVEGWEYVRFSIESAWDGLVTVARRVGGFLYDAFASVVGPIADVFGGLFDWLGDAFDAVFGWIVRGVQKLVGWIADAFSWLWENTIGAILDSDQADAAGAGQPGFTDRQAERRRALSQALEDQKRRRDELDQLDPVDEAAGVLGFDAGRARKGLEAIGANLGEAVKDALDQLGAPGIELAQTANVFAGTAPIGPAALLTGAQVGEQATRTAQAAEVLGTFNASTAGQFGFGQRTEQQQLDAARETARNTRELLREFRNASQDRLL